MTQPLHFLERLTRVTPEEAALAAELARDAVAVKGFLLEAHRRDPTLPTAARYALPLSSAATPAHILVTAEGHPVTCLAAGMPMHDSQPVPHALVASFVDALRGAVKAAVAMQRDGGGTVLDRLLRQPQVLTRGDVDTLATMAPLLTPLLTECVTQATDLLKHDLAQWVEGHIPDGPHVQDAWWPRYLRGSLAMGLGAASVFPARAVVLHTGVADVHISGRAAWHAMRRGAETLDVLEDLAATHGLFGAEHELGVGVALHSPLLSGRVRAFLRAHKHRDGAGYLTLLHKALDEPRRAIEQPLTALLPVLPAVLTPQDAQPGGVLSPETLSQAKRALGDVGALTPLEVAARLHKKLALLVEKLTTPSHAEHGATWTRLIRWIPVRFNSLPLGTLLLARAPQDALLPDPTGVTADWSPEMGALYVTQVLRSFVKRAQPAGAAPPGPNAPCPCGSGKKFKKCHGASR